MRRIIASLVAAVCASALISAPAFADKPKIKNTNVTWQQLTQGVQVWVLSSKVRVFECVKTPTLSTLALKSAAGWIDVVRSASTTDRKFCPTGSAPFVVKYEFKLTINGQQDFPGTHAKLLNYRITSYRTTGSQDSFQYGAAVYSDTNGYDEDQADGNLPGANQDDESDQPSPTLSATIQIQPKSAAPSVTPSPSDSASPESGKSCSYGGIAMYGRVRVVSAGARFKVRIVRSNAMLQVKSVTRQPVNCGEWQFVSSRPNFTVQIVLSGEDFTISLKGQRPRVSK